MAVAGCGSQSDDSSGGSTGATAGPQTTSETGDAPTSGGGESTTGGEAGSTSGSTGEASTGMTGGSTSGTDAGETTTGGACIGCGALFMGGKDEPCEGSKAKLDALFMCVCGACADVCDATCTMGEPPTDECQTCQNDAFTGACDRALTACLDDG